MTAATPNAGEGAMSRDVRYMDWHGMVVPIPQPKRQPGSCGARAETPLVGPTGEAGAPNLPDILRKRAGILRHVADFAPNGAVGVSSDWFRETASILESAATDSERAWQAYFIAHDQAMDNAASGMEARQGGDVKQAPLVSGAVPEGQTPNPSNPNTGTTHKERDDG